MKKTDSGGEPQMNETPRAELRLNVKVLRSAIRTSLKAGTLPASTTIGKCLVKEN